MTDKDDKQGPDSDDTGKPLQILADLEVQVSDNFIDRVKNRIERRNLGAEMTGLMWFAPGVVLLEFLDVLLSLLGAKKNTDR